MEKKMKVCRAFAVGICMFSMGQFAFSHGDGGVFATVTSPFLTTTGVAGTSTALDMAKAQKLGLDEADVEAIQQGRMTDAIRRLATENDRSEEDTLHILQAELALTPE